MNKANGNKKMIDPVKRHADIKHALAMRGRTLKSVAERWGVSRSTMTMTSKGERTSRRMQVRLARACGIPVDRLFQRRAK